MPLAAGAPAVTALTVRVGGAAALALRVSENYTLSLPSGVGNDTVAVLAADTQWGALRGLETFSQLFIWSGRGVPVSYCTANAGLAVADWPRYPWRGLLIDSARHFLPLSAIFATLEAASFNKINTLHWHIVDDQSWPLFSQQYPNFTAGAYCADCIYSHEDISRVVDFAEARGIRVIPEFDMPAHAAIWGKGYPALEITCPDGPSLLNPIDDGSQWSTYTVVDNLLAEFGPLFRTVRFSTPPLARTKRRAHARLPAPPLITPLFQADVVHFGGDEVESLTCWNESAAVRAFAAAKGLPTMDKVRNYFEDKIQTIAAAHGLRSMFWEEVRLRAPPPPLPPLRARSALGCSHPRATAHPVLQVFDKGYAVHPASIVDVWLSYDEVDAVVAAGNNVVISYGLYLDQQRPAGPDH